MEGNRHCHLLPNLRGSEHALQQPLHQKQQLWRRPKGSQAQLPHVIDATTTIQNVSQLMEGLGAQTVKQSTTGAHLSQQRKVLKGKPHCTKTTAGSLTKAQEKKEVAKKADALCRVMLGT